MSQLFPGHENSANYALMRANYQHKRDKKRFGKAEAELIKLPEFQTYRIRWIRGNRRTIEDIYNIKRPKN